MKDFKKFCSESTVKPRQLFCPECNHREAHYVDTDINEIIYCDHCKRQVKYSLVDESSVLELIKKIVMVPEERIICPMCNEEIGEKESYCPDYANHPNIMIHGPCGGRYKFPHDPEAEKAISQFFGHSTIHNNANEAKKAKKTPLSASEREEVKAKFGSPCCSFTKDKSGIYCYTHRSRSKSYKSVAAIPKSVVKFIESTG